MPNSAAAIFPCADLNATIGFFRDQLGFRLDVIFPADDPRVADLSGHGIRLRLERGAEGPAGRLRLVTEDPERFGGAGAALTAPNGTVVEIRAPADGVALPPVAQRFHIEKAASGDASWGLGRAGMQYRDLIPDRQGGRFIASHIRIPAGGPIPDYVHYHMIRFQMIHVRRGWVRLVYEDQGPPFVMQAGDCVLQPPEIRHRVLECSDGFEVVEVGCPAEHPTHVEHQFDLPTPDLRPERDFGGQRYHCHRADGAAWAPWRLAGFERREIGFSAATEGLASAAVIRPAVIKGSADGPSAFTPANEFHFLFVLDGALTLIRAGEAHRLGPADAVTLDAQAEISLTDPSADLELLEVTLPA
ncbi:MAG: cupin [Alphaproteobacteria bacterium]|nr:cupin [Alphaproteobacteria bacterium]